MPFDAHDAQTDSGSRASLGAILDGRLDNPEAAAAVFSETDNSKKDSNRTKMSVDGSENGVCVECEDQPTAVNCKTCSDNFCEVCFAAQHRKGNRRRHVVVRLNLSETTATSNGNSKEVSADEFLSSLRFTAAESSATNASENLEIQTSAAEMESDDPDALPSEEAAELVRTAVSAAVGKLSQSNSFSFLSRSVPQSVSSNGSAVGTWFVDRSKSIPVRLTLTERKYLRLLEAALNVSEYTDRIDILTYSNKPKRIVSQIKELCAILSGLVLAADYKLGQELFQDRDFESNAEFFQTVFELGRRHKIMNPEKMRETYGKLVYLLQDAQSSDVQEMLQFSCVKPIRTVYRVLSGLDCGQDEQNNALRALQDDLIAVATMEIISDGKPRHQIQNEIKLKERAIETLARRYGSEGVTSDMIRQCLYSIGDNHAFLRTNRDPCDRMLEYLSEHFQPSRATRSEYSLAIQTGRDGARLTHNHERQYQYVLQSLTLWREVLHDMFNLWTMAEDDLLDDGCPYRLRDTGQGLNRVQPAPRVSRMMHTILARAQRRVGGWVGSSVIHLGDHNVPNALMFIDKYTQIHRILLPVVSTLSKIPAVYASDASLRTYMDAKFNSLDDLLKTILTDFFRHAFDGSGADNFFDAGSCIDGRLTSAWNWCSQLEKKSYFNVFLLTGFTGFDGRFE